MKEIFSHSLLILLYAGIFSCKKDSTDYRDGTKPLTPAYHVSFYDHKTGEKITGLKAEMINLRIDPIEGTVYNGGFSVNSDAGGTFNFDPYSGCSDCRHYLTISTQTYVEALYEVNHYNVASGKPIHYKAGSGGANVVYAKLLRTEGNDFYFRADLYRKAPVDIHIRQVNDFSDTLEAFFNAGINGSDPADIANNFGISDLLGEGLKLNPNKKIDTTIRVYAFGDYLNKVSWSVYGISLQQSGLVDIIGRKSISTGDLEEKIFPSDTPTSITITF